jgi:hypothetical protein
LLEVFCIEVEGYFRLIDQFICWKAITKNIVLPSGRLFPSSQLENSLCALDLVELYAFTAIFVFISDCNLKDFLR